MAVVICEVHIVGHHGHSWLRQLPALIHHALLELILEEGVLVVASFAVRKGVPSLVMHEDAV